MKRFRLGIALLLTLTALGLTGCGGEYVNQDLQVPGTDFHIGLTWIWLAVLFFAVVGPVATLIAAYVVYFHKRVYSVSGQDSGIELYVRKHRLPVLANAVLVPVAPDLKMGVGAAKLIRDYGADAVQYEANKVAPLPPGEAFIGTGARFRYLYTVLAVIFDEQKRTSPELIKQAIRRGVQVAREQGAKSIIIPDMTENLLSQPNIITPEQRRATAEAVARLTLDAVMSCRGTVKTVRLWVYNPENAEIFKRELQRVEREGGADLSQTCTIRDTVITITRDDVATLAGDALLLTTTTASAAPSVAAAPIEMPELATVGAGAVSSTSLSGETFEASRETAYHSSDEARQRPLAPVIAEGVGELLTGNAPGRRGSVPLGDFYVTTTDAPPRISSVMHLVVRRPNTVADPKILRDALQNALVEADAKRMRTLIIPNVGAGGNDYPPSSSGPLTVDAIADYLNIVNRQSNLRHIILVTHNLAEEQAFSRAIGRFLPFPIPAPPKIEIEH